MALNREPLSVSIDRTMLASFGCEGAPADEIKEPALRFQIQSARSQAYDPDTFEQRDPGPHVGDWSEMEKRGLVEVTPAWFRWRIVLTPAGRALWRRYFGATR